METIPKNTCEKVGFFRKTHGIHGELVLEYEEIYELSLDRAERIFVELEGLLVPFFIKEDGFRYKTANTAIIHFDYTEDEKQAKRLIGKSAFLLESEIVPDPETESVDSLIGYTISDQNHGDLGTIEYIDNYSGNVVFTIIHKGEEILIPFNEDFLIEIDPDQKKMSLKLPEGLVEI